MTTGKQVRAARQLVDWTAEELATRSGLTKELVLGFERGERRPLVSSVEKIIRTFTDAGVVFVGDTGVNLVGLDFRILEGSDCYLRLLDEVYHSLQGKKDAEVLSICTDDSVSPPEVIESIQKWHNAGIQCRFLSHEKAKRFDFPLNEYRLIPSEYFKNSVMVIYSNKVATLRGTNDAVLIVEDSDNADMLRGLFELIWEQSKTPKERTGGKK